MHRPTTYQDLSTLLADFVRQVRRKAYLMDNAPESDPADWMFTRAPSAIHQEATVDSDLWALANVQIAQARNTLQTGGHSTHMDTSKPGVVSLWSGGNSFTIQKATVHQSAAQAGA
mgnify:CR=1 FL=1